MRRRFLAFLATLPLLISPAPAAEYDWPVLRVIDGDTLEVRVERMPVNGGRLAVRLRGIDAPKSGGRARCAAERALAARATAFVCSALASARHVAVVDPVWDKWGGRVLADVAVDGASLADALLAGDLARPFTGGRRPGWCAGAANLP